MTAAARQRDDGWAYAKHLLGVRLDAVGDVLMTTPALRALKHARGGRRITLLTSPAGADIAHLVPDVDDTIVYQAPWMKSTPPRADAAEDNRLAQRLRDGAFDGAVIFTVYTQSPLPAALLCSLADIPRRLAHCRENPYQLLTDWVPEPEPHLVTRHEVRRQLDLVAHVGARTDDVRLSLVVPAPAYTEANARLEACGVDARGRWAVIHPGANAASRRYPPERYAEVAHALVREHGWQIVFTGSASEATLIEHIREMMHAPSHTLAGDLSLSVLCALVASAPVLIVNNTGPAHIAAAVGTPVVDLYALTNLQHMPWLVASRVLYHDVPCKNCYKSICPQGHHACLRRVAPRAVVEAAVELVARHSGVCLPEAAGVHARN